MSAHEEEATLATKVDATGRTDETSLDFLADIIPEKFKVNLEPLHAHISTLSQMMDRLIQGNSAREFTTASALENQFPSESPLTDRLGTSRTPPIAPMTATGYSLDNL